MISAINDDYSALAEGVGFEPTYACAKAAFKTAAIVHSASPPKPSEYRKSDFVWQLHFDCHPEQQRRVSG